MRTNIINPILSIEEVLAVKEIKFGIKQRKDLQVEVSDTTMYHRKPMYVPKNF